LDPLAKQLVSSRSNPFGIDSPTYLETGGLDIPPSNSTRYLQTSAWNGGSFEVHRLVER